MVSWDKRRRILEDWKWKAMKDVADGMKPLTDRMKYAFYFNLQKLKKAGFPNWQVPWISGAAKKDRRSCLGSKARVRSRKLRFVKLFLPTAFAIASMSGLFPGNRTSFCLDTRQSFSFMDVSGMDIPAANMHILPKTTRNSGLTKYQAIRNGMQRRNANLKNQDGR